MRKIDVLYNFISPVTGRILLDTDYIFLGDANGIAIPNQTIKLINLPDLTNNYIWVGDNGDPNRPQESNVLESTFIIKQANSQLPNAESLNTAIYSVTPPNTPPTPLPGIAKVEVDGSITIAIPDVDYLSVPTPDYIPIDSQDIVTKQYLEIMLNTLEQKLLNKIIT